MTIKHRNIQTNGINMRIAEAGEGPLVIMCHGFPESWYSWRHQIEALAEAGYHAVAPDQRGYGKTDKPRKIESYSIMHLGRGHRWSCRCYWRYDNAVVAGHDWGAPVAWNCALMRHGCISRCHFTICTLGASSSSSPLEEYEADVRRSDSFINSIFKTQASLSMNFNTM